MSECIGCVMLRCCHCVLLADVHYPMSHAGPLMRSYSKDSRPNEGAPGTVDPKSCKRHHHCV